MVIRHEPTPGTALWLYAHPRRGSLNDRLLQAGTRALSHHRDVQVSDLYAQGFDPALGPADLGRPDALPPDAGPPGVVELSTAAFEQGVLPREVAAEQAKLASAELLVIQFPLWWYGMPAMLKGWFDRVLTGGFAHGDVDPGLGAPRRYGDGAFAGRRALIVVTAGEDAASLGPRGISGDLESLLFPLTHGILWYVGFEALDVHVVHDADDLDAQGVEAELTRLSTRLQGIDAEQPRRFRRLADGEYRGTRALRADILPGRTDLGIHRPDEG